MTTRKLLAMLMGASALTLVHGVASAQTAEMPAAEIAPTAEDTASQVEFLQAQVEAMQAQLDALKKQAASNTAAFKAAPEFSGENGWKFKIRGRMMYDIGYVENPSDRIATQNLGFNSRIRRARLGVEGTIPGGFSYKAEADFANNAVSWADLFLEYKGKGPLSVRAGHFETFQSLEQITSSRHIMFLERAQMNDGFGHGRRLGGAIGFDQGDFLFRAGLFNDTINADFNNDEWLVGARAVWAPKMGSNQLHFGVNYQHREFSNSALNFRYRARPFLQTTDQRFVDTNTFAAGSDDVFGVEAAGVFGSLHLAAEAQWVKPKTYGTTRVFTNGETSGAGVTGRLTDDPTFMSYYLEAGYWLTGETRGYKKGEWDRTKVKNGFDKGGWGAVGINVRYDYLDLSDAVLRTGGVGTSTSRGGKQTGYLASIIWQPIDYVRITTQYARANIEGGPLASTIVPVSTSPVQEREYDVDTFAMRVAFDF